MSLEPTTNFRDSNGVDLGSKLVTKDYLISVYPSIADKIGISPELWTWGEGNSGRLGTQGGDTKSTPVTTSAGGTNWKQVSAGSVYTAAIKTDGTLWVWGAYSTIAFQNTINSLTSSSRTSFTPTNTFAGGTDWKQVSSGDDHTAAIKTDGTLWVWGSGLKGRLGTYSIKGSFDPITTFIGGNDWKQVSAGKIHTAAIKTNGTLWVWGGSNSGGLGVGTIIGFVSTPVTTFAGGTNWTDAEITNPEDLYTISFGFEYATAIKTDGTLWTWGRGVFGQLGNASIINIITPITTFAGGTNWKQVSAGDGHTAAIKTDGTLWTWGLGQFGRLGNAVTTNVSTPVTTFAGGTNWKQVSSGGSHTAAIKTDGTLWVWGNGNAGRLGNGVTIGTISTPITTFAGGTNWKQVSAGDGHTAAIKTDGTLWTWGSGDSGRLGNAVTTNVSTPVTTFAGGTNWKQVSSNLNHTAAVKTDGTLWTWGAAYPGKLGNGVTTGSISTPITTFAGGTNWKQVSTGNVNISAMKTDGTIWMWGDNVYGRLGNASVTFGNRSTPITTFAGGTNWTQVSSGGYNTIALNNNGQIYVWGNNAFSGQLGINNTDNTSTPVTTFAGGTNWLTANPEDLYTLSAGTNHTSAIKTDGTLWTWGNGFNGALGINNYQHKNTPVTTSAGGTNWKQVSAGNVHTAAIKTDGTLWTWGTNFTGVLGIDLSFISTPVTTFAGGANWADTPDTTEENLYIISAGSSNTAAIKTDGTLWVWGANYNVKLGTNDTTNKSTPVTTFSGGTNWKRVSAGYYHTAAIKTDGTLWTWGNGIDGKLGTNNTTNVSTPVTTFAGGTNWKQVRSEGSNTVAIKTDGTLWTWGNSYFGQLGNASTVNVSTPVTTFAGGTNWKQATVSTLQFGSKNFIAAIKTDGTLWTWGYNNNGGLGNASITDTSTPVTTFAGGTDWKQVDCGQSHIAAIKTDGTLWTWGYGSYGRLGNASTTYTSTSTPVTTFTGGTNWKQVSGGNEHTAAVKTDGTLWIWGRGSYGRLGTNDTITRSTPVTTFAGGTNWKQVDCGSSHTVALKDDGVNKEIYVFGNNFSLQLGTNDTTNRLTPATTFAGGTNWADAATTTTEPEELYTFSAGDRSTVAIKTDGTLWTWGNNFGRQLGNAVTTNVSTPVTTFAGGTNWKQVNAGGNATVGSYTMAIKTDGTLWVWGSGSQGQLGINGTTTRSTPVTTFAGGTNWKQVSSATFSNVAAIKTNGTLWTWGNGSNGELGNGQFSSGSVKEESIPVEQILGATNWKQVSANFGFAAAIKTDGTLWTWGTGGSGQLGRGILTASDNVILTPVTTFAGGTNWADTATGAAEELYTLSAGNEHTSAIKTDGTLWIWGFNGQGRLGVLNDANNTFNKGTPVTTFAGGTNWKQVSAGTFNTAAIKTDGTLWAWGVGGSTMLLGTNDSISRSTPVTTFAGGTDWKQVSVGDRHMAAVKTDGTLWTWGNGSSGRLGTNATTNRSTPVTTLTGGTDWKQVSAGNAHTAAIKTDGTLWIWGLGTFVRLGTNSTASRSTPVTTFAGGTDWKQVSAGYDYTSAVKTDGTLWTWGNGTYGRLGNFSTTNRSTPVTTFAGGTNWKQVSSASSALGSVSGHTAAVKTDGTLWTWGSGGSGRLGTNDTIDRSTPVTTFAGGTNWKQVSNGRQYTIALKDDGINKELYVFGNNNGSALGILYIPAFLPSQVFGNFTDWKQVSCGYNHTAAVKTDGTLWVWGNGAAGRLGTNNTTNVSTPVTTFAGGTNWKQVSAGGGSTAGHMAAVKTDGTLWVWGNGAAGRLGTNNTTNVSTPVTTFAGGTNWKQVNCGFTHTIALRDDGVNKELYVFGNNTSAQLGISGFEVLSPTSVNSELTWKQVSSGNDHTAAIKTDGTLWVWGNGGSGKLGTNNSLITSTPVTTRAGGTNWKQVSAGNDHTAAIKTDGTLWVWGRSNNGQVGDSSVTLGFTAKSTPVTTFAGGTDWKQVSAGNVNTAAIKTDGTLWVWGFGFDGSLGNASTATVSTPVTTFAGGTNWKQVSAGNSHTVAVKTDGTLWTWGDGSSGQLGNANTRTIFTPVTTFMGGANWKQVYAGVEHTVALKDDGVSKELYVFGDNDNAELGINNSDVNYFAPVTTFAGGTNWKQVDCGGGTTGSREWGNTAAIKTDGTLWTWGEGNYGMLGNNNVVDVFTPATTFAGGTNWKQVSCGTGSGNFGHTAAIKTDGTLWTWGYAEHGSLGVKEPFNIATSTPVTTFAGGTNWADTATGAAEELYTLSSGSGFSYEDNTTLAIKTDGTLWSWGYNSEYGSLGINTRNDVYTPVTTFAGGTNWKQISTCHFTTAAIKTDGTLWMMGAQYNGRLGDNTINYTFSDYVITPITTFAGGTNWKQVSTGYSCTAGIKTDGTLWVWGYNINGQLGVNDENQRFTPVTTFAGGTDWKQVSCGGYTTAAIKTDGTLYIWGANFYSQLGIDNAFADVITPITTFAGGSNWKQVNVGPCNTAAVKTDGTLWIWGTNGYGQIGNAYDSFTQDVVTPVTTFAGGTNWKQVSCGGQHADNRYGHIAAIKTDGTLWTWGYNFYGSLGNARAGLPELSIANSTPVTTFAGGTNWKQVTCGQFTVTAIKGDGINNELHTFGISKFLGINYTKSYYTPITTFAGGTNWKQVSVGSQHTVAIKTDGTLWTWGNGNLGRHGNFAGTDRSTPITTFAGGTNWKSVDCGDIHTVAIKSVDF